jgi:MoxR-like ATPase
MIQGTAGTTEDQLKYSWNYALLLAQGPSEQALVKSPLYRGMESGRVVRIEEVTRILPEVQVALISVLSEKSVAVPELAHTLHAARGFNVIATANTRDRGVNEMSSALRRRFNFVTLPVLQDLETEIEVVTRRVRELQTDYDVRAEVPRDVVAVLTAVFQELRSGRTLDGRAKVRSPASVLSTADLIGVLFNGAILSSHFGSSKLTAEDAARSLVGAVSKDHAEDLRLLREYVETILPGRKDPAWKEFASAASRVLP